VVQEAEACLSFSRSDKGIATGDHQFMVQEKVYAPFGYSGAGIKTALHAALISSDNSGGMRLCWRKGDHNDTQDQSDPQDGYSDHGWLVWLQPSLDNR
jgi:hypothetical protein